VATSANIAGQRRLFTFPAGPAGLDPPARTQMRVLVGEGEATLRVVALSTGLGQHRLTGYAGLPITEVDRSISELTLSLLVGLPAVAALLAALATAADYDEAVAAVRWLHQRLREQLSGHLN